MRLSLKNILNPLLGALITAIIVTPILMTTRKFTSTEDLGINLIISATVCVIGGVFALRIGVALGSGIAIVIAITILYLSSNSTNLVLLHFVFILIAIAVVVFLKDRQVLKWVLVAIIDVVVIIIAGTWKPMLVITSTAIVTACLISAFELVENETKFLFESLRGRWGPIIAYLLLSIGTIFVFALWYRFAFLCWPNTAFADVPNKNLLTYSEWYRSIQLFLYQSVLIFTTAGPPYPPINGYTRFLVSLELFCSILLLGLYLSVLVNFISQRRGG